jgi:hypothetical protein
MKNLFFLPPLLDYLGTGNCESTRSTAIKVFIKWTRLKYRVPYSKIYSSVYEAISETVRVRV